MEQACLGTVNDEGVEPLHAKQLKRKSPQKEH